MLAQRQARGTWSNENFIGYGENSGPLNPAGLSTFFKSDMEDRWSNRMMGLIQELEDIQSLQDNWDGEGAEAPKSELVDSTITLLRFIQNTLPPPTRITPSQTGNIVLEWQFEDNIYLEAEIVDPFHIEWMLEVPFQPTQHWEEELSKFALAKRQQSPSMMLVRL